jgi:ADP-ribose pyrophosphatase YjhB (NUDIX family)
MSDTEGAAISLQARLGTRRYPDRPIVGVLAVVLRGDKALVVRRSQPPMAGRWGFPGGVLELGETVAQGAMRELLEEAGIVAEPAGTLTVLDSIQREDSGRVRYHYTLVAVRGIWQSGEGIAGDDADEVAWFSRTDILGQDLLAAPALLALFDLAVAAGRPIGKIAARPTGVLSDRRMGR